MFKNPLDSIKCSPYNFSKIKNKLEATLDDMEDALEKEKRARVEQDKARFEFHKATNPKG
jgi:hypothetical protein